MLPLSNKPHHIMHLIYKRHVTCFMKNGKWWKAKVVLPSTKTCSYPQVMWVEADAEGVAELCPVACLAWLLQAGDGGYSSPLVTMAAMGGGASLVWTRASFVRELRSRLSLLGVDANKYIVALASGRGALLSSH